MYGQQQHLLSHACHPGHPFVALREPPASRLCAVCKAASNGSCVAWYACCERACDFLMCHKCFEVKESLFSSPQVVLRNPLLSHNDDSISVHTRPKEASYRLAPLYPGKFVEVVSSAESTEERGATYYRVSSGGWINGAHVISVPSEGTIARLAQYHLQMGNYEAALYAVQEGMRSRPPAPVEPVSAKELIHFTKESIDLMENNPAYGIVMASLTMYPVLLAVARTRNESPFSEEEKATCDSIVGFLYYVLYVVVEELECNMEDELPIHEGTMLSLYQDILVRCIVAGQDLQERWHIGLPESFAGLILRAIAVLGRVQLLIPLEHKARLDTVWLRSPSVITTHNALHLERERLQQAALVYTDVAARLLLSLPSSSSGSSSTGAGASQGSDKAPGTAWDIRSLLPIREVLTYGDNESLEKVFCDLAAWCIARSTADQRSFLCVDPLEVAVRLCKASSLAESQLSVFKFVAAAAHCCPRNISVIAPVMAGHLLSMANAPRSPAVAVAAINCFYELTYNDPRGESAEALALCRQTPPRGTPRSSPVPVAHATPTSACTHALHPGSAPFQLGHVFALDDGGLVSLCDGCAANHPPANAVDAAEPLYMHFACQCICCRHGSLAQTPVPPPTVPSTSAIVSLSAGNVSGLLFSDIESWPGSPELLNAVGRLALRMRLAENVIRALLNALLAVPDLRPFADAALAVACHRHLPCVTTLLAQQASAPLCRYINEPYTATVTAAQCSRRLGDTVGTSSSGLMRSTLGLSPSPDDASTYHSRTTDPRRGSSLTLHMNESYPAVDLFPAASRLQDSTL